MNVNEITDLLKNPSKEDIELITHAFEFSKTAHEDQKRKSGEPYFIHPFETAKTLAHLQLDAKAIAAGLLHDTCEDCNGSDGKAIVDEAVIKKEFGEDVAFLVNSVTKLGTLKYRKEKEDKHEDEKWKAENLRKMFLAMAQDVRVILIKLADRLHNMETLEHVPKEKQERIARETLEIYAPIANRLGMGSLKGRLEDLAFPYVYPEDYKKVLEITKGKYEEKKKQLLKIKYKIEEEIKESGIKNYKIDWRVKHIYSLYKKLKKPEFNMDISKVYDLIALRIVVDTIEDCYKALGLVHKLYRPFPGRIKDYIAVPKINGYQSLHTTIFADGGNITEVQIRTQKMHEESEHGIAAHWAYDESGKPKKTGAVINPRLAWINQLVKWQKDAIHSKEFFEDLKIDFFKDRVFCFTPKGDVIDLPEGATAIDFAYAVHSEVGNQAIGAVVNEKFVSLDTPMKNANIVEIRTQKGKKPSSSWLEFTKTTFARRQIKLNSKR